MVAHRSFKASDVFVPFDFDGKSILWMEYREGGSKAFQTYVLATKETITIKDFGNQYHFLSFGRLVGNDLIFIENNKNVNLYSRAQDSVTSLYSHSSSIIAFEIVKRDLTSLHLVSVDFNGIFKEWRHGQIASTYNLWNVEGVPRPIVDHKLLFDMGYPYYIKLYKGVLAITTDLGLIIFRVWSHASG